MACATCGHGVAPGTKFCPECGAAQISSCVRCGFANAPTAKFCQDCGNRFASATGASDEAMQSVRHQMTMMFVDLADSTRISATTDAEDFAEMISNYLDTVKSIIVKHNGHIGNYTGDGLLAYFGYPRVSEDDAERACIAGLEIVEAVSRIETQVKGNTGQTVNLEARCGIHTGTVLLASLGGGVEPMGVGESVNLAARMEGAADNGRVAMSGVTERLIRARFETEALGAVQLKGIGEVECFHLVRPLDRAEIAAKALEADTALVGRDSEVQTLTAAWRRAAAGTGEFVAITGDAGLGKARLIRALRDEALGARWLAARASEHTAGTALAIASELLADLIAAPSPGPVAEPGLAAIESFLDRHDIAREPAVQLLAPLLGVAAPAGRYPPVPTTPQVIRAMTLQCLVECLVAASRAQPTVVVASAAQWVDSTSVEFVESLAARLSEAPLLLIVSGRGIHQGAWRPDTMIFLNHLRDDHAASLVRGIDIESQLSPATVSEIVDKGDGNPLYIGELTRALLQADESATPDEVISRVPETLNELLLARLDRIGQNRTLIQHAAAIGRTFSVDLLEATTTATSAEITSELSLRVAAGQLRRDPGGAEGEYTFQHALLLDAAEQSMTRAMRAEVNSKLADAIAARSNANPEIVARHLQRADRTVEAAEYWTAAGGAALGAFALVDALEALSNGLALLRGNDSSAALMAEIRLRTVLGVPLMLTEGFASESMADNYRTLLDACERAGEDAVELVFPALWGLWTYHEVGGRLAEAEAAGQRLLDLAASTGNSGILLAGHCAYGAARLLRGDVADAREHLYAGLATYDMQAHSELSMMFGQDGGAMCASFLTWVHAHDGDTEAGEQMVARALEIARTVDEVSTWGFVSAVLASYRCILGQHHDAASHSTRVIELGEQHGMPHWEAQGRCNLGWVLGATGQPVEGIRQIMAGLGGFKVTGTKAARTYFSSGLVAAQIAAGDFALAQETLDEMDAFMVETGEVFFKPRLLQQRAQLLAAQGDRETAASLLDQAIAEAERQGATGLAQQVRTATDGLVAYPGQPTSAPAKPEVLIVLDQPAGKLEQE